MMEIPTKKRDPKAMNIQYPLPWVPADQVQLRKGDTFADVCNAFPEGKAPSSQ
jgi:ribose transport system substrate-binding protein